MDYLNLISATSGLNTVVDPTRISYDPDAGISDLGVAVNIKIDDTGRPGRVDGFYSILSGAYHSVFCDGWECYVGKGTSLFQINTDLSEVGVRSGLSGSHIAYTQCGEEIYYSNGSQKGILKDGISRAWSKDTDFGPDNTKYLTEAPLGNHLAFAFSRMFVAEDKVLWWSEPFRYGLYNQSINFVRFPSKILLVKPVESGLFISDEKRMYFLRGNDPHTFIPNTVANYPAYEWSESIEYVEGMDIGIDSSGLCALWHSKEGAILGTSTGRLINLNKSKVIYPESGQYGASLLRGYDLIHTII